MREPNFMTPKRSPAFTSSAFSRAADDPARQDAHDLANDDRLPRMIDRDLGALVQIAGLLPVRRAGTDPDDTPPG